MDKLFKLIKELEHEIQNVMGEYYLVAIDTLGITVQHTHFKDFVERYSSVDEVTIKQLNDKQTMLSVYVNDMHFYNIVNPIEYREEYHEWLHPKPALVGVTSQYRDMRDAGHKQHDFA